MRLRAMNLRDDEGQAIVLVCLAMGIFLLGAVGLGFDGSHLYSERQRAQLAADAAAQAAMMSIFNGTTGASGTGFPTTSTFTCTTTDTRTPCVYASKNGFGSTSADTVTIDYPGAASGVSLSAAFTTNLVRATVSRNVNTTLMRLLGPTVTLVKASAEAAIVDVNAPVPILILHPTSTKKMPSPLSLQGTPTVQICGGPGRSIQVNSISTTAINIGGSAYIDLTKAGPNDTKGTCTTGTGADLGNHGGPGTTPEPVSWYGTTGKYVDPASIMLDPLRNVSPPSVPTVNGTQTTLAANATSGGVTCPSFTSPHGCTILTPGLYPTGIKLTGTYAMFRPGIYYLQGSNGFQCNSLCDAVMISGTADGSTGTNTGWDGTTAGGGMLVYNTGTGQFQVGSNGNTYLIGSPASSSYKGILFFQDRTSAANNVESSPPSGHSLGGGGAMTLVGTIYLTNTVATISADAKHYQELDLQGSSGSGTKIQGEIIVDSLQMGGTGGIVMNLNSNATYIVSEVALVQ